MLSALPHLVIIFTAFAGVLLASYIRYKKKAHQVMVCPMHSNCEAVTHSEFSRFLGIPVELLGIAYYVTVALAYAFFLVVPAAAVPAAVFALVTMSTAAILFSAYLTFIQAFTLRQWCTWCLTSAGFCAVIFATSILGSEVPFVEVLARNREVLVAAHLVGLILGLGGATISDIFFFKFLRDFRIAHPEADILRTLSQVIWLGIAILVLSGIGLYVPQMHELNATPKFLVKAIAVAVVIVNGAFLNLFIAPELVNISFGGPHHHLRGELHHLRRIAFALGAVSFASWYTAFILGLLPRSVPLSFGTLLLLYLGFLGTAVLGSQVMERVMIARSTRPAASPSTARTRITT